MDITRVYKGPEKIVQVGESLEDNPECTRCSLGVGSPTVCTPPYANKDAKLLVVASKPHQTSLHEIRPKSRILAGIANAEIRKCIKEFWTDCGKGGVAVDHAVRCVPPKKPKPKAAADGLAACRSYLSTTINSMQNLERIITVGPEASESVLGFKVPFDALYPYNWVYLHGRAIPVFSVPLPITQRQNTFEHSQYVNSLRFALQKSVGDLNPPPWGLMMYSVTSDEDASVAIAELRKQRYVTLDAEWAGRLYADTPFWLLCIALTGPDMGQKVYLWDEEALIKYSSELKVLLADKTVPKSGQNIKADFHAIRHGLGVTLGGIAYDTRYQKKLYMADSSRASLDVLTHSVGMGGHKKEMAQELTEAKKAIKAGRKDLADMKLTKTELGLVGKYQDSVIYKTAVSDTLADVDAYAYGLVYRRLLDRYNALDTYGTMLVQEYLNDRIDNVVCKDLDGNESWRPLKYIWETVIGPGVTSISKLESWGVQIDTNALNLYRQILTKEVEQKEARLNNFANINWGSPLQRSNLFYDELKLPSPPDNVEKGKRSTSSATIKWWIDNNLDKEGILQVFQEYQKLCTYKARYTDSIEKYLSSGGRIHPNFNIDGAATGRMSCNSPNLQQIPSSGDIHAKSAKNLFVSRPGYTLIQADFSQLEYRIAAAISRDPVMKELYTNPETSEDFHMATAKTISKMCWGIEPGECTKAHRSQAKSVNFAVLYGSAARSLAGSLGITLEQAEGVMSSVLGAFKKLDFWVNERHRLVKLTGFSWTYWDGHKARRRPLFGIGSSDRSQVSAALRQSVNSEVQGTGSDYCLASINKCVDLCENKPYDARVVLTVHDSIIFEVPDSKVDEICPEIKQIMESWDAYGVPIIADIEVGKKWGTLENYVFSEYREQGKVYWYASQP